MPPEDFTLLGRIRQVQTIASGRRIRELSRLRKHYGTGRWRKMKGTAQVRFSDGTIALAEVHWYQAHESARRK